MAAEVKKKVPQVKPRRRGPQRNPVKPRGLNLRFYDQALRELFHEAVQSSNVSANTWVLQAIAEKVEREHPAVG